MPVRARAAFVGGLETMMSRHVIEILYTERCRFLSVAVERVRYALFLHGAERDVEVRLILVETFPEAVARRFRGSPTVRVDGEDVETRPGAIAPIGLFARGYVVGGRIERAPTVDSIQRAIGDMTLDSPRSSTRRLAALLTADEAPIEAAIA